MNKTTFDTDAVLNALLGKDTTPEIVDKVREKLKTVVLPWRENDWSPAQWVRMTANGRQVGLVDSWLGGFAVARFPRHHGWGYKGNSPTGQGNCTSGIIEVDCQGRQDEVGIVECENNARLDAMQIVDDFLREKYPELRLLEDEDDVS